MCALGNAGNNITSIYLLEPACLPAVSLLSGTVLAVFPLSVASPPCVINHANNDCVATLVVSLGVCLSVRPWLFGR